MKSYSLAEIAKWIGGAVRGDASTRISGIAGVEEAEKSEITWIAHDRYIPKLRSSRAGAVLVPEQFGETAMPAILCANPSAAVILILEHFAPPVERPAPGAHPSAVVAPSAKLGRDVAIGPNVVIGDDAKIGDRTILHAGVYIGAEVTLGRECEIWPAVVIRERCVLGNHVIVHPNTTIGSDGFGYQFLEGKHRKIPQIGTVYIEDDVEIGANCAIDRAKFGATRIGTGTKIDNLVQVAHNVQIGPNCLIVAQCGIAGSSRLGRGVVLGGQVGVRDHVVLHDGAQSAACACISKDVPAGTTVIGVPAMEREQFVRERAKVRRLPQMADQLQELIKRVDRLESAANDQ
jgi:UDP-3-O-[3-hydroxymyristoyl] glucosamine N-acyltransferase